MKIKNRTHFTDHYLLYMSCVSIVVLYYNFYAQAMLSMLSSYKAFSQVICAGFDPLVTSYYPLTFPMWGYGFLMVITEDHLTLLFIQLILAFFSVKIFVDVLQKYHLLTNQALRFFKILLISAVPWYAFHTVRWPYSIASSLLILSISYFYRGIEEKQWFKYIILSSLCFGLLLNFRSDYILMPLGFSIISFFLRGSSPGVIKKITIWFVCIYLCLIPWLFWTKKNCGQYLATSTNGGHVLMSGLGQYPHNRWGLKCDDGCMITRNIVTQQYGKNAFTWDYKGDLLLKKKFINFIINYPEEYIRKLYFCFFNMLKNGIYQGEFFTRFSNNYFDKTNKELVLCLYHNLTLSSFFQSIPVFLQRYSYVFGKYVLIFSCWFLPFCLIKALYTKNLFYSIIFSSILYQFILNVFLVYLTGYGSNLFVFMLLLLVSCCSCIQVVRKCYEKFYFVNRSFWKAWYGY